MIEQLQTARQELDDALVEKDEKVCEIKILAVEPLDFNDINEFHAEQEAIELPKLKQLIREIYPSTDDLFLITYELVNT